MFPWDLWNHILTAHLSGIRRSCSFLYIWWRPSNGNMNGEKAVTDSEGIISHMLVRALKDRKNKIKTKQSYLSPTKPADRFALCSLAASQLCSVLLFFFFTWALYLCGSHIVSVVTIISMLCTARFLCVCHLDCQSWL